MKLKVGDRVKFVDWDTARQRVPLQIYEEDTIFSIPRDHYEKYKHLEPSKGYYVAETTPYLNSCGVSCGSLGSVELRVSKRGKSIPYHWLEECFDKVEVNNGADSTVTDSGAL